MRMLNFYINRAGKKLTEERHRALERAKETSFRMIAEDRATRKLPQRSRCIEPGKCIYLKDG